MQPDDMPTRRSCGLASYQPACATVRFRDLWIFFFSSIGCGISWRQCVYAGGSAEDGHLA